MSLTGSSMVLVYLICETYATTYHNLSFVVMSFLFAGHFETTATDTFPEDMHHVGFTM